MMDAGQLKKCIGDFAKDVYFCGANENDQGPTLYTRDEKTRAQLTALLEKEKIGNPVFGSIKVETTRSLKLKQTRSLEEILARIPHQTIYLDPTATIERSNILVCVAKQARQLLGPVLKGCYFNSEKRNFYFLVKPSDAAKTLDLSLIQKQLEPIILNNTKRLSNPFYFTITISLLKPQGQVVAVDKLSIVDGNLKGLMKSLVNKLKWPLLLVSATSSLSMAATTATTAVPRTTDPSMPAVSNVNEWVGGAADYLHNERHSGAGGIVEGGVAAPLSHDFGGQLHTYDGFAGGATLVSVDGYVFWRNPVQGLVGPHVLYTKLNSFHHTLYGLHGEGYLDNLTLVGEGGGASGNQGIGGTYYAEALVHWYAQPDWRVYGGAIILKGDVTGEVGTEYQLGLNSLPGLAIFGDVGVGAHDLSYGFLGLRYYFNGLEPDKSLVRRQREDMVLPTLDPINPPAISHM